MHQSARSVAGFWILAAMLLVSVASSAVPSPIYPVYAAEWHLTPLMLTGVFAIYVAGLLASLLVAGRLSDHVGRKPVLVVGGLGVALSLGLFAMADGVVALIVDRIVQGVSVGLLIGALGAALIDNSLERHPTMAGVLNGVIPPIALATGAMSSGALVQWGPAPEQLVYLLFGALLVLLVLALFVVPEQVQRRPGALRSLRPTISVPRSSRRLFRGVAGSLVASWALGGMFLSIVPSALGTVFGITNHFAAGALIAVVTGVGALTGLAIQRMDTRRAVLLGLVALVLGSIVTVSFVFAHSLPGMVVGSAIAGVGFGAGFQAPLRMLLATAAPTHRAGLLSTIYVVSYLAFGVPSVIGGLLEPSVGLVPVIAGYGGFIVLAAVVALVLQLSSKDAAEVEERAAEVIERTATGSIRVAAE
ncbi:MFS transporter [Curtobacterium flaccumfaciens]|uniref:MFS transporter n=1 Tax=Curtobacterium flaccumfaciens TaxID=2035 RepID=UPI000FFE6808|nr:MFS transporter [Curtobacterium flaccumfaciens]MCS0644569.1 MFS transporter [Curtobacterium flaccumfaciens pv. flaccumfaciens]MCS6525182.1 MFS transporter [Curtobacterium flaccumfaciens pv. flaccumfaciens]MCS6530328.1 MFS transporter [Curtobacterium flaccumfaciens pv. flaccumfaciens]NUU09541.1 MFS transporter [Curtobacterium flaccumfaciens]RXF83750.1 MFS transporter [Curtobacterium flaccumfaciens pv. flaccumfaciens]